ncbi:MAG: MmgE/PrpD family protein [Pseudomonadota bacterium]
MLKTGPIEFIHQIQWADLSPGAQRMARLLLRDLIAVAAAARATELSRIVHDHAAAHLGAGGKSAHLMFDGREVSPIGAALAGGMTIDAVDAHDGYRPSKGHAGCSVFPATLALAEAEGLDDGAEFLTCLALGYELGCRAGVALHATVPDYHTSGAWGAVACAGIGARLLGLDVMRTREALGIAEYHGPRSQMMRCIDHPTMVKDGSGMGAMTGVQAAYLAAYGFTGAPAVTVEAAEAAGFWEDLGRIWLIEEQYVKPQPVCRWAQGAIHAAVSLMRENDLSPDQVAEVEVHAFHEATRLATRHPATTEQAQYSLPFPVAVALIHGDVRPEHIRGAALHDSAVLTMIDRIKMVEDAECNAAFPAKRLTGVALTLTDGRRLASGLAEPAGDPERPLSDRQLLAKYHAYADPVIGAGRARDIDQAINKLANDRLLPLISYLVGPI